MHPAPSELPHHNGRRGPGLYRRLPEEVRRCLRPLNLLDEGASLLPAGMRAPVTTVTDMARRLARLGRVRYRLRHLEGRGRGPGARLSCVLATDDLSFRYWKRALFADEPAETLLGDVPALHLAGTAARLAGMTDLSLWQASWPISLLTRHAPTVPSTVPLWLATDRPLDAIIVGDPSGRGSRKNDVRGVRRLALHVRQATEPGAVEAFRRELYAPYGRQRFGDLFAEIPAHSFRHAARQGWLLSLEHAGRPVAGALLERWQRDVRILAFGVDLAAPFPTALLLEACYYHAIAFAAERRFPRLSLGTCRPVLTDGVLRYKRKWGARLGVPTTWDGWLLRYRNTPATRAALTAAPLLLDPGDGRLAALVAAAGADLCTQLTRLATPGVHDLACLVDDDTSPTPAPTHGVVRLVPPGEVWPAAAAA